MDRRLRGSSRSPGRCAGDLIAEDGHGGTAVSGNAKPKPTAPVGSSLLRSPRVLGATSLAAIRLDPKNVQAYTGRAISYQKKGDIARAKVDYEKALSLDPDAETSEDVQAALDALGHDRRRIFRRS